MPRVSKRRAFLLASEQKIRARDNAAIIRFCLDMEDSDEDIMDKTYKVQHKEWCNRRYLFRSSKYRCRNEVWKVITSNKLYLNEYEFLGHFRMTKQCFTRLLYYINSNCSNDLQLREIELLVALKFLGNSGNDSSAYKHAVFFGLGMGSIYNYSEKLISTLLQLKERLLCWPCLEERQLISERNERRFGFPGCIGIIDGTLFPLNSKPTVCGEDYFTRKGHYAVHSLVICDDNTRIRYLTLGWAGSVHDNRVWTRSKIYVNKDDYFRANEFLLGDSAFLPSSVLVPLYKKPWKAELDRNKIRFNTKLAKLRIKSEHCIGVLKARFQILKGLRRVIATKNDMIHVNRLITACAIIHNLMLNEQVPLEWIEQEDTLTDNDELNQPVDEDGERREQLAAYIADRFE
jgi:hypothetical protein